MMNDATLLFWSLRFGDCPEYVYPDALCENDCHYAHLPTLIRYNSWDCGVRLVPTSSSPSSWGGDLVRREDLLKPDSISKVILLVAVFWYS